MPPLSTRNAVPSCCRSGAGILLAVFLLLASRSAWAQLTPDKPCAHLNKPILATLAPAEPPGKAEHAIELINPATGLVVETRSAKPGRVDLGELFPRLWTTDAPTVMLAQAVLDRERIGPPVVLAPMTLPRYASKSDRDGSPRVNQPAKSCVLSGYWIYTDQRAVLSTSKGELVFALHPEAAPNSVANFRDLIAKRFYDGIRVHRIATLTGRTRPDLVQFGDPGGTGQGGPGYYIDYEPSPLRHEFGSLSFARTSEPNSAGSQVMISLGRNAASQLDGRYTVFGRLISGAETLIAISRSPADADGKPRLPVTIEAAKLVDAPPYGSGPKPEIDPLDKPASR
jgi:cyclophilin family peptidyl-prolyl cis-trans isomerase